MEENKLEGTIATIREVDEQIILDDPQALEFINAIKSHQCFETLKLHSERVVHFKKRVKELNRTPDDTVLTIANVDDEKGALFTQMLMPNIDWQVFRDRGEIPFSRGLAVREGVQDFLDTVDPKVADKLRSWKGLAVVIVDHDTFEIFPA